MKYIAAYLLLKLGGKENPNIDEIKNIIESVGIMFDEKKAEEIVDKLQGKNLNEIINNGKSKLSVASNPQTTRIEQQDEIKEQNEKENDEEEETLDLGGGFDDLFS